MKVENILSGEHRQAVFVNEHGEIIKGFQVMEEAYDIQEVPPGTYKKVELTARQWRSSFSDKVSRYYVDFETNQIIKKRKLVLVPDKSELFADGIDVLNVAILDEEGEPINVPVEVEINRKKMGKQEETIPLTTRSANIYSIEVDDPRYYSDPLRITAKVEVLEEGD